MFNCTYLWLLLNKKLSNIRAFSVARKTKPINLQLALYFKLNIFKSQSIHNLWFIIRKGFVNIPHFLKLVHDCLFATQFDKQIESDICFLIFWLANHRKTKNGQNNPKYNILWNSKQSTYDRYYSLQIGKPSAKFPH